MQDHAAALRTSPVLENIQTLPRSQRHAPAQHRNRKMGLGQRRADVRGHVIRAFERVTISRIVFRNQSLEKIRHVEDHIRVRVFLDDQGSRGVLDEDGQQCGLDSDGSEPRRDLASERIEALPTRPDFEAMRELAHTLSHRRFCHKRLLRNLIGREFTRMHADKIVLDRR